jgi:hypothetical protein
LDSCLPCRQTPAYFFLLLKNSSHSFFFLHWKLPFSYFAKEGPNHTRMILQQEVLRWESSSLPLTWHNQMTCHVFISQGLRPLAQSKKKDTHIDRPPPYTLGTDQL